MYSIIRLLYRSFFVNGKPLHQVIAGVICAPVGLIVAYLAYFGDPETYYPYWIIVGIVFAIFGVAVFIKGIVGFATVKQSYQSSQINPYAQPYTNPAQYQQPSPQAYSNPAQYQQPSGTNPAQYQQPPIQQ
ncbi:hypothetical protein [Tengunoibacter tsumagoiensis]|uniref:Uncharacterized protein n=1 Tax=Tengunoibacter tsumagoiensis TaxID=2014871 RepID=A0A401ZVC8_9CHLR|nr:hypothetical protein [Tengunoibacter tsumagoiensis]GCE10851.1 hypothetical protein KTT_07100 [Tengunoibacter tsumagoiensis]